jgi:hypothetical protein
VRRKIRIVPANGGLGVAVGEGGKKTSNTVSNTAANGMTAAPSTGNCRSFLCTSRFARNKKLLVLFSRQRKLMCSLVQLVKQAFVLLKLMEKW